MDTPDTDLARRPDDGAASLASGGLTSAAVARRPDTVRLAAMAARLADGARPRATTGRHAKPAPTAEPTGPGRAALALPVGLALGLGALTAAAAAAALPGAAGIALAAAAAAAGVG
ncbi:MAG: hypothetical protein D6689_06375, partial [Deltaproteobacteria bacterium]